MKKMFFPIVVFALFWVIGCEENSITDPISEETINKNQNSSERIIEGKIPLEGLLEVHGKNSTYYYISGSINYIHEILLVDPIQPAPQYYIDLKLKINASLADLADSPVKSTLNVSGVSEDIFYVSEDGIYLLEKSVPVDGGNYGMMLVCRFLVTTDNIVLNAMWLTASKNIKDN